MHDSTAGTAATKAASPNKNIPNTRSARDVAKDFAIARGISEATLARLGASSGTAFFPDLGRECAALIFHYAGGWKARAAPEKSFVCEKGFTLSFCNLERVLAANPSRVFMVEGEMDMLALVECGIPETEVLSVPNGAKLRVKSQSESDLPPSGLGFVEEALAAGLNRVQQFIWCGDNDEAGLSLRADMVRALGPAKFCYVDWPEGIKDANDLLMKDGADALRELVSDGALPWPVAGLYRLDELPEPPRLTLWKSGFDQWEGKVALAPRTLSVVTGHPGHGKTQLMAQVWYQIVRHYAVPMCVASFETRPKPHLRRQLRTLYMRKLERHMEQHEKDAADRWINERYLFIVHPEQRPTLEWFLDMAEVAVIRHGARIIQLDPWNRLEGARGRDETETEYIGRCLRTLHAFAHDMNCHVQIVAHPAKMDATRRGRPPMLEDISGSKNWDNMVDQGFAVHRPEVFDGATRKTEAALYQLKVRFEELGHACKLNLNYEIENGRYVSTDYVRAGRGA